MMVFRKNGKKAQAMFTQSINQPWSHMGVRRLWSKNGMRRLWGVPSYLLNRECCLLNCRVEKWFVLLLIKFYPKKKFLFGFWNNFNEWCGFPLTGTSTFVRQLQPRADKNFRNVSVQLKREYFPDLNESSQVQWWNIQERVQNTTEGSRENPPSHPYLTMTAFIDKIFPQAWSVITGYGYVSLHQMIISEIFFNIKALYSKLFYFFIKNFHFLKKNFNFKKKFSIFKKKILIFKKFMKFFLIFRKNYSFLF